VKNSKKETLPLKIMLMKCVIRVLSGLIWLRLKNIGGCFANENEITGSIKEEIC
jgi:hypothetical protein